MTTPASPIPRLRATPAIAALLIVSYALQIAWGGASVPMLVRMGGLTREALPGEPWQLLSYSLLHFDLWHLLGNLADLVACGALLEAVIGWRRLVLVYVAAALGGALLTLAIGDYTSVAGASGATFGVLGATSALLARPGRLLDEQEVSVGRVVAAAFVVLGAALPWWPELAIAHEAHLGGFLVGAGAVASGLLLRGLARDRSADGWAVDPDPSPLDVGLRLFFSVALLVILLGVPLLAFVPVAGLLALWRRPLATIPPAPREGGLAIAAGAALVLAGAVAVGAGRPWVLRLEPLEARELSLAPVFLRLPTALWEDHVVEDGLERFGRRPLYWPYQLTVRAEPAMEPVAFEAMVARWGRRYGNPEVWLADGDGCPGAGVYDPSDATQGWVVMYPERTLLVEVQHVDWSDLAWESARMEAANQLRHEGECFPATWFREADRAGLRIVLDRLVEADLLLDAAQALDPEDVDLRFQRARLHRKLGDWDEAEAELVAVLERRPDFPRARRLLAWQLATCVEATCRDAARAREVAGRLLEDPSLEARDLSAAVYAEEGRPNTAAEILERGLHEAHPTELPRYEARLAEYRAGRAWRDRYPD